MGRIGILAVQGGFAAHQRSLEALGLRVALIRQAADLAKLADPDDPEALGGLVLPGGESTTQLRLIDWLGLASGLAAFARSGRPVLATCAGLILAAREVTDPVQRSLGWLDATVSRNAWGRQVASFEAVSDDGAHPLVFIRAPRIVAVGAGVEVLAALNGEPVLVRQGHVFGATFHPELTTDLSIHRAAFC